MVDTITLIHQAPKGRSKRDLEDAVAGHLVRTRHEVFRQTYDGILRAEWFILPARRAKNLLREMLFDRVFALRIRNFARAFPGAELDMHFSLSRDLIPLGRFLETLHGEGSHKVTTLLERGDF
jgi:hypothetical protein